MLADEDDMIVIVVEDENDQQIEYEDVEEYQEEEVEEMVLDEVTGKIISSKNIIESNGTPPPLNNSDSQDQSSSDNHNFESNNTSISSPVQSNSNKYEDCTKTNINNMKISKSYMNNNRNTNFKKKSPFHQKHRNRQLPAEEAYSIVQELRDSNPELVGDEELLKHHVADLMRNIKVPPIPDGYSKFLSGMYECSICRKSSHTKLKSELHYLETHGPRYLKCFACGADFRCLPSLYRHERSCAAPDAQIMLQARALVCVKGSKRPSLLKDSKKRSWLMCELCRAVLSSKSSLEAHLCRHRGEWPYKCSLCTRSYTARSSLVRHMLKHDEANKYQCKECQRVFRVRRLLLAHLASHNKHWKCPFNCGKFFATASFGQLHVDTKHHNKPMPCACNLCPFRCFSIELLRFHMEQKHGLLYMSDNSMDDQNLIAQVSEVNTSQISNNCDNAETDEAVHNLKEIFYVTAPNVENCIEVTTAPIDEGNEVIEVNELNGNYYELVIAGNEINGLKEGYYEVVQPKEEFVETKSVNYEVVIEEVTEVQSSDRDHCEVDEPSADCSR